MSQDISIKNTKNQILSAYNELLDKIKGQKSEEPKKVQEEARKTEEISKASQNSTEGIIKGIGSLKLEVSKELDKLSEQLTAEYEKLEGIQKAIELERKNLEDLYQVTANADSLAAMLMAQKEMKQRFETEMAEKKQALEDDIKSKQDAFNEKMKVERENFEGAVKLQKEQWKEEVQKWNEQQKELKTETEKLRKREEEEYQYNLKLQRKKETDVYEEKKAKLEKDLAEKKATFEKEIAEREAKILAAETELKELRKNVAAFPEELKKAVADAEKAVNERLTREFEFEKQLLAKQNEGDVKLKDQIITTLQSKIKDIEASNKELAAKANTAESNSKEIALKAIDSSRKLHIYEKGSEKGKEE